MISGLSYTNKDFNTIYSELLDLVKTLTNKWDPSISNESDPGVVLIKLGALLADKNNYNIDKNILELFPLSVSQYGNARKIYDIAGYAMKWYQSASTELTFTYTGSEDLAGNVINIKKYDTMVSNEDGNLVYTLIEDVVLSSTDRTKVGIALQGVIKNYEVNGVDVIKLDNLDDNNRIYFDERMIAENGIFISSASQDDFISDWERVDTLQTRELNARIFKFGVTPDSDTCYIEFPQDIANLIGSGLKIKYIVSSGIQGNVSSGTITSLYSNDIIVSVKGEELNLSDSISITNVYAATNGKDPETLDEAYDNFKDTIGTFNTLVTCKDYETAANDLYNTTTRNYMQSNCVVSDRTNDIVSSTYVITLSADGTRRQVVNTPGGFDAFTIGLYALEPMNSINSAYYYNKSFSVNRDLQSIKDELENYKSIQHDWFDTTPNPSRKYIYKNFYKISGSISTYDKVSTTEATEIKNNVMAALYDKYNARNIDFGTEIPFDDIVSTIENADTRIKYVVLNQPEYTLRYMLSDDFTGSLDSSRELSPDDLATLLAKMVLSGSVQLYNFDKSVDYAYGQTSTNTYPGIESITTSVSVPASEVESDDGYTVKANENIQLFATNLISTIQYTAYVNYCLEGDWSKYSTTPANINTYIALSDNMKITFNWVDSNNSEQTITYDSEIIKCSFELSSNSDLFTITKGEKKYRMLEGDEAIDIMGPNETVFKDTTVDCLWFLKNGEVSEQDGNSQVTYTLFAAGQSERILENNEYFMYTNKDRNSLVILTSGTKLIRGEDNSDTIISVTNSLNAGAVVSDGISAVGRSDWFNWNAASGMQGPLTVRELQIVTLGEGARLKGNVEVEGDSGNITNTPVKITDAEYSETSDEAFTPLPVFSSDITRWDLNWYVRSRLNLNTSPSIPQSLQINQSVTVKYVDKDDTETIENKDILSSIPLSLAGGDSVDVTALMEDGSRQAVLQLYSYTPGDNKVRNNINKKEIKPQGEYYILSAGQESGQNYTITFDFKAEQHYLIPVIKPTNNNVVTFSSTGTGSCSLYNGGDLDSPSSPTSNKISAAGSYILHVKGACSEITVTWSRDGESAYVPDDIINFGMIKKVGSTLTDRYSNDFTRTVARNGLSASGVLAKMTDLVTSDGVIFDYTYEVDPADTISTVSLDTDNQGNVLDPRAVWDINHICNKFTIAQLNIRNTNISVASSSIK